MTIEFFLSTKLEPDEVSQHLELIRGILNKTVKYPNLKQMKNLAYLGEPVFRAKINDQYRLIFTWKMVDKKRVLFILDISKHNYKKVNRGLDSQNPKEPTLITLKENQLPIEESKWAIISNNKIIVPDEEQKHFLHNIHNLNTAVIYEGPPGAGKTTVLYTSLMLLLEHEKLYAEEKSSSMNEKDNTQAIFFSHSPHLLKVLAKDAKTHEGLPPITFTSWPDLLIKKYPGKKIIYGVYFADWFGNQKCSLPDKVPEIIHYEFSLIQALGFEKYQTLGERQCYYSKATTKIKTELEMLLKTWLSYLEINQLIDPMVNFPKIEAGKYHRVFCDEAQNMPPVALHYLINSTTAKGFASCLDSEQCLTLSPYIENCLQTLLFSCYGKYTIEHLPRSWRVSDAVADVANHLMRRKHQLDGNHNRRNYREIQSALDLSGIVSWINKEDFGQLNEHCKDPETAVLVPDNTNEFDSIKKALNTDYILCYNEAIGLDLKNVILWKPFSQVHAFKNLNKHKESAILDGLTLVQWKAFNALFVSLTRAPVVYLYEEGSFYKQLGEYLLANIQNSRILSVKPLTKEEIKEKYLQAIDTHLNQHQIEIARNLMKKIEMTEEEILNKIKPFEILKNQSVFLPEPKLQSIKISKPTKIVEAPKASSTKAIDRKNRPFPADLPVATVPLAKAVSPLPKTNVNAKIDPFVNYAINLLKEKNLANLDILFKHKNLVRILFKTKVEDSSSLFLKLLADKFWEEKLLNFTKDNCSTLSENFANKFLFEPVDPNGYMFLIRTNLGREILLHLISLQPTIASNIRIFYESHPNLVEAHFIQLCESSSGINLLYEIYNRDDYIARKISGKVVFDVTEPNNNKSPLLLLLSSNCKPYNKGQKILETLDLGWFVYLNSDVLCSLCPREAGDLYHNTSVLYWMVKNSFNFFKNLLSLKPALLKGISAKAFYTSKNNFSVFGELLINRELNIIKEIFKLNPNLTTEMKFEDLCFRIPFASYFYTPLFLLVELGDLSLLEQILSKNLGLVEKITEKELFENYYGAGNSSVFQQLVLTTKGKKILRNLFRSNSDLASSISWKSLNLLIDNFKLTYLDYLLLDNNGLEILNDLMGINSEIFTTMEEKLEADRCQNNGYLDFILEQHEAGRNILKKIHEKKSKLKNVSLELKVNSMQITAQQPKTISSEQIRERLLENSQELLKNTVISLKKLFEDDLIPSLFNTLVKDGNMLFSKIIKYGTLEKSLFHLLCESEYGLKILNRIFYANANILDYIPQELIGEIFTFEQKNCFHEFPLVWFISHSPEYSVHFLIIFIEIKHSHIIRNLNSEILCRLCPSNAGDIANTSALYWLAKNDIAIFEQLLIINPKLLKGITAKALFTPENNFSAFFGFLNSDQGLELLQKIFTLNPNLINEITFDHISFQTNLNEDGLILKDSPLYRLIHNSKGFDLVNKLFNNPNLVKALTGEILCDQLSGSPNKFGNSLLFEFTLTKNGINILDYLCEYQPKLLQSLTWEALTLPINTQSELTPLVNLVSNSIGIQIFSKWVDNNPEYSKRIVKEITTCQYIHEKKVCSLLSLFKKSSIGQQILKKINFPLSTTLNREESLNKVGMFKPSLQLQLVTKEKQEPDNGTECQSRP